jgi:hypothetical protein
MRACVSFLRARACRLRTRHSVRHHGGGHEAGGLLRARLERIRRVVEPVVEQHGHGARQHLGVERPVGARVHFAAGLRVRHQSLVGAVHGGHLRGAQLVLFGARERAPEQQPRERLGAPNGGHRAREPVHQRGFEGLAQRALFLQVAPQPVGHVARQLVQQRPFGWEVVEERGPRDPGRLGDDVHRDRCAILRCEQPARLVAQPLTQLELLSFTEADDAHNVNHGLFLDYSLCFLVFRRRRWRLPHAPWSSA